MARKKANSAEGTLEDLFALLREQRETIIAVTAKDTGIGTEPIGPAFEQVLDLVAERVPSSEQIERWREQGVELARQGVASERVYDAYLSLNWAIWEAAMGAEHIERKVILDFADRLLRGLDDAIAAISEGYIRVEVELAAEHSDERRAVIEELLSAPRTTPRDRARIRRRASRHGLDPLGTFRLILIHVPGMSDEAIDQAIDALERRVQAPVQHHRTQRGIRLPVVLDWRGRVLVFAMADWVGEKRLRAALPEVLGDEVVIIDSGPVETCEALLGALAHADAAATVATDLGRRGWVGDPNQLALETTFLLDAGLARTAVEQELGPLLADSRMGEELIETLEVYFGSKQNIREAARRLHLAPRTVAYRLERIEALLGRELEGETAVRVNAALLALRVNRQTGAIEGLDATAGE